MGIHWKIKCVQHQIVSSEPSTQHWLDQTARISRQLRGSKDIFELYFGVKFYAADPTKLIEEITRWVSNCYFLSSLKMLIGKRAEAEFHRTTSCSCIKFNESPSVKSNYEYTRWVGRSFQLNEIEMTFNRRIYAKPIMFVWSLNMIGAGYLRLPDCHTSMPYCVYECLSVRPMQILCTHNM